MIDLVEIGWGGVDWNALTLANVVMNPQVP
jgi:hypothetical protein